MVRHYVRAILLWSSPSLLLRWSLRLEERKASQIDTQRYEVLEIRDGHWHAQ